MRGEGRDYQFPLRGPVGPDTYEPAAPEVPVIPPVDDPLFLIIGGFIMQWRHDVSVIWS